MPVAYKRWFLNRLTRELETSENTTQDTAAGSSTPARSINMRQLRQAFGDGNSK